MSTKNKNYEHVQTDHGINGQYKTWFLDYASYVILERAVCEATERIELTGGSLK